MTYPIIPIRPDPVAPPEPPPAARPAQTPLARSGRSMALGTITSRGTGFLRTAVIAAAIGEAGVGSSYAVANTVPNALYDLLLGGILGAVIVPLLVQAAHDDGDAGDAYAQRLLTVVTVVLTFVAILAVVLAPIIIGAYAHSSTPQQRDLAITFARFFLPQLLFYGIGATIGAILNVRGSFAPPMWVPVINNVVVIATGVVFVMITHATPKVGQLSHTQILVLGIGTTAGVVLQTVALLPALRHSGFRLKARWDWRGVGLRKAGPFAAWMLGYVVTNQLGFILIVELAESIGIGRGRGAFAVYANAYVLFSLPYAVIAVTVITALFPGMSRSATEGDEPAVVRSLANGLSIAGVLLVPATVLMIILGPQIAVAVFQHGHTTPGYARLTGRVLVAFVIGLVPFSAFQMQLRAWLAVHDSRTPMLVNLWATATNLVLDVGLYVLLPNRDRAVGLALGYSLSYVIGTAIFTVKLRRRFTATHPTHVIRTYVRLGVAGVVAAVPTLFLTRLISGHTTTTPLNALITIIVASAVGLGAFVLIVRRMRVSELADVMRMLPGRA